MLTIRYYNRAEHKSIEIEIPADVVAVKIPPQEGQPPGGERQHRRRAGR